MNEYDYDNPMNKFVCIVKHIYLNEFDNTYHFVDETENYQGPYKTLSECKEAYTNYVEHCL